MIKIVGWRVVGKDFELESSSSGGIVYRAALELDPGADSTDDWEAEWVHEYQDRASGYVEGEDIIEPETFVAGQGEHKVVVTWSCTLSCTEHFPDDYNHP